MIIYIKNAIQPAKNVVRKEMKLIIIVKDVKMDIHLLLILNQQIKIVMKFAIIIIILLKIINIIVLHQETVLYHIIN